MLDAKNPLKATVQGADETGNDISRVEDQLLSLKELTDSIDFSKPFTSISGILGTIGAQLGPLGIVKALNNLDESASKIVKSFGISKDRSKELVQNVADAIPQFVGLGLSVGDVTETIKGLGDSLKTNVMISSESLANFAATSEVTGVKQAELAVKFRDVGVSIGSIGGKMLDVVKIARQAGVTVAAVSEGVVGNLDKMNLYNFEGGIKGLSKMAAQASRLGVNMQSVFAVVDKVFNPEGAIEFAASLQRLGVTSSELLDPLRLMDLAQNDPTELQNQIVNMTKEFTRFNKENNQIEILPGAKRRIEEIGKSMGLPSGELQKMAVNAGMFEMKLKQIKFPTDIATKEDRELIATMAQINESGQAYVRIEQKDASGNLTGEYMEKLVSNLDTQDVKDLATQQKSNDASMEEISKNQLTELRKIASSINEFVGSAKYGIASSKTFQDGYKGTLGTVQRMIDTTVPKEPFRRSDTYRTGTDAMIKELDKIIGDLGLGGMISNFTEEVKKLFNNATSSISNLLGIGSGGVDTRIPNPNQTLIQSLNNPNLNIPSESMTITTDNKFSVDFKVSTDEKISAQAEQDINKAVSDYFNGPDSRKNMENLLMRIDQIRTSSGQKPIFKK
jgi:hypothetical protein